MMKGNSLTALFDPTSSDAKSLDRDWTEGGFLILSDEEKDRISKCSGKTKLEKFHNICAYQLKLGFDLAISPLHNVSQNPGFESVLGSINTPP